jgi:hypothetical protein
MDHIKNNHKLDCLTLIVSLINYNARQQAHVLLKHRVEPVHEYNN